MLFSQKAKVMRVNPLDLIDGDYIIVVCGIYYNNGYPDNPMWLQEDIREEISFFTVICGVGLCQLDGMWTRVPGSSIWSDVFKESTSMVGRGIIPHQNQQ